MTERLRRQLAALSSSLRVGHIHGQRSNCKRDSICASAMHTLVVGYFVGRDRDLIKNLNSMQHIVSGSILSSEPISKRKGGYTDIQTQETFKLSYTII